MSEVVRKTNNQPKCVDCGKTIDYGCKRCRGCYKAFISTPQNNPRYNKGKPKCVDCGKQLTNYHNKRCMKCSKSKEHNPNWTGGKVTVECIVCGKERHVVPAIAKNVKYCSTKCRAINWEKSTKGEGNNNWKGGITPIVEKIRHSFEYEQWRNEIFKRDKFTCVNCSDGAGGNLRAHHIEFFSVMLLKAQEMFPLLPLYDAVMLYKPMWDINNGITYCKKCHEEFHIQYNRINNNKEVNNV